MVYTVSAPRSPPTVLFDIHKFKKILGLKNTAVSLYISHCLKSKSPIKVVSTVHQNWLKTVAMMYRILLLNVAVVAPNDIAMV